MSARAEMWLRYLSTSFVLYRSTKDTCNANRHVVVSSNARCQPVAKFTLSTGVCDVRKSNDILCGHPPRANSKHNHDLWFFWAENWHFGYSWAGERLRKLWLLYAFFAFELGTRTGQTDGQAQPVTWPHNNERTKLKVAEGRSLQNRSLVWLDYTT